jgi:uncharacterized repeat protein (TIGR03803 family)
MFSGVRFERKSIFGALAILMATLSLTMAPAARAVNNVPDAMPTGTETVLYSFGVGPTPDKCNKDDGADPKGSLTYVAATGLLFGTTANTTSKGPGFGTIFQIMPSGAGYAIDHFFAGAPTDGADPQNNAMTLVGDFLYGTTLAGGENDSGAIFSISDNGLSSSYSTPLLYNFTTPPAKNSGDQPYGNFVAIGSVLYGITSQGGLNGGGPADGTIFTFDTSTGTYKRLYSFNGAHGFDPHGQLILDPNGKTFYGMTHAGGSADAGVVFSFSYTCSTSKSAGKCKAKYKVLHSFSCPNNGFPMCINGSGASPDHGTLVQNGSTLFGLTTEGGKYGNGVLFSIQTTGQHFTIQHSFGNTNSNDGSNPQGSLLLNGTTLYGTTRLGGNKGKGSVFQINTDGTNYDRIWDFQDAPDAQKPIDNVILLDNTLYGTTEVGGQCGNGAIFSLVPPAP